MDFQIKDSGKRTVFDGGMVRDASEGKIDYTTILDGPMYDRWASHLTKAKAKYPDISPGIANWTLASGEQELQHARKSLSRHYRQYMRGDTDEDHGAAIFFNINEIEYIKAKIEAKKGPLAF